ncbi:hypothetical protein BD413DRAFT_484590 [Trametes elegans]|nr:hypothetical protein BD413DRAFT_484590 [Trametes elegans]
MATVTRSFVVFKDEPELPTDSTVEKKENQTDPSATYVLAPPPGPALVYAPDKENIDPLTGIRPSEEQASGKKRKTALSVKAQPSSPSKRLKPLSEKATKKPAVKARLTDKKTKRSSKRVVSSAPHVHREPSLPRVVEEKETTSQAVIDSKCKELTVLPLADISEAHDVAPRKEEVVVEKAEDKEAPSLSPSQVADKRPATPLAPPVEEASESAPAVNALATPERKRIYSAFTFSSPSPAGQRYASARASSVEHFSDAEF